MNRMKKITTVLLAILILVASMPIALAMPMQEKLKENNGETRMYATDISLSMAFVDGEVAMTCSVSGPLNTESISILFVLREENAAGNLVIADTWNDGGTEYYFFEEYSYSPAVKGREYELSVRVGIYDKNGLVGYDYETISAVY